MRCKACDYSLWGITGRTCPECGNPFKPSDFRLVPNAVRFKCPRCAQDYYGTTPTGHLDPPEFECVTCGAHIHMDEMVLEPREGVKDERTRPDFNPWLQRKILGTRKAYYRTIGRSIGYPARLARGTPDDSPTIAALGFFAVHVVFISLFTVVPLAALMALMAGGGGHRGMGFLIIPALIILGMPTVGFFGMLFVWSVMTQLMLMFLAGRATHLRITVKALAYASAPLLVLAVPCMGAQLGVIAIPWWLINGIVMLGAMHRIAWWRAAIAVVASGVVFFGAVVGGVVYLANHNPWMRFTSTSFATQAGLELRSLLLSAPNRQGNPAPVHIIDLMQGNGPFAMKADTLTMATVFPFENLVSGMPLQMHIQSPPQVRDPIDADLRAAMQPSGVHRVSHIVICEHGVDLNNPQGPDLWIAIVWPDPDSTASFLQPETVTVILASGHAQDIPLAQFPADLATQNADRTSYGIPVIPDPATVRMWLPGSQFGPSPTPAPVP